MLQKHLTHSSSNHSSVSKPIADHNAQPARKVVKVEHQSSDPIAPQSGNKLSDPHAGAFRSMSTVRPQVLAPPTQVVPNMMHPWSSQMWGQSAPMMFPNMTHLPQPMMFISPQFVGAPQFAGTPQYFGITPGHLGPQAIFAPGIGPPMPHDMRTSFTPSMSHGGIVFPGHLISSTSTTTASDTQPTTFVE